MSSELVFPGDEVAIEEEYMGGEGTFSEDGTVYASQVGVLELDDEECIARVVSPNPPNVLKEGDIVYAVVADIRNTMATADVIAKDGVDRTLGGETYATIHVSKISPKYTDDVSKELGQGHRHQTVAPADDQGRPPGMHQGPLLQVQDRDGQEGHRALLPRVQVQHAQEAGRRLR